ncbi:MAG: DUF1553 domain-containing protein [Verrucomicrobia bacterium]|nr:DUF1553 domain-containing protein [Verrucomicrobiota bacterium]MBI3869128.1 DUF1553 domain-containing protein [Verrucomicrobiota bacterium]
MPCRSSRALRARRFIAGVEAFCLLLAMDLLGATPAREPQAASTKRHWAFEKPQRPFPGGEPGAHNPIDALIQARIRTEGLRVSPEADRSTLLRRVSLDLTGLPPSLEDLASFLADRDPGAYERVVDRLLNSPHYGERWGRWWLDAARYADSNGYSIDSPRSIWPYRDWVVRALNADMPFDQFTLWQIAGDLMASNALPRGVDAKDPLIATGFHRNTQVNHEGGVDVEQFRVESVVDRVNTTATVWLGITLACAQCHDHKFDPLTQRDYYRFFAFFNSCENDGHGDLSLEAVNHVDLGTAAEIAARDAHRAEHKRREAQLNDWLSREIAPGLAKWEASLTPKARSELAPLVRDTLEVPPAQRGKDQSNVVWTAFRNQSAEYTRRRKEIDSFKSSEPRVATSLVMRERREPRETRVLIKGDFTRPSDVVEAGTPAVLPALPSSGVDRTRPNRLDLARWLTSPENPLTARVLVNRVWQQLFGRGIVETENDFGTQGSLPSHPELLDGLAIDLMSRGWSLKALLRSIVTSATYRQSSTARSNLMERDPSNRWLARQSRIRLDAEVIRDAVLSASGLLDQKVGGPPVFPPQPTGLGAFTQNDRPWATSKGPDRYRRALYTHLQRTSLHPALAVFDAPDSYQTCTRRLRSNTPLQALALLNDPAFTEFAEALGRRLAESPRGIDLGFQLCLSRSPKPEEKRRLGSFVSAQRKRSSASEPAIWTDVARVLLNLDETITRE